MTADPRLPLTAAQADLVAALTAGGPAPAGFDPAQLHLAARTLISKRRAAVAKTWPALAAALADRFKPLFADYAAAHTLPDAGPVADGGAFAEWLLARDVLPDDARVQLLLHRARRGRPLRWMRLTERRRLAVALRVWGKLFWFAVPIPTRKRRGSP